MACVIWITGLSASGKTTLAKAVASHLASINEKSILLDGDQLRSLLGAKEYTETNHSREVRLELALRYSSLCQLIVNQNITTIISTISMFKEVHLWNRENLPNYIEVYLKVPLSELRKRDPKNIYKSFDRGEIKNIAGIDLDVDEPNNPDLLLEYKNGLSIDWCVKKVIETIYETNKCRII